jgi:hypothetical protein
VYRCSLHAKGWARFFETGIDEFSFLKNIFTIFRGDSYLGSWDTSQGEGSFCKVEVLRFAVSEVFYFDWRY